MGTRLSLKYFANGCSILELLTVIIFRTIRVFSKFECSNCSNCDAIRGRGFKIIRFSKEGLVVTMSPVKL